MLGSEISRMSESSGFIVCSVTVAPARSRTRSAPATSTVLPFANAMTSSIVAAIPSTAPASTASWAL